MSRVSWGMWRRVRPWVARLGAALTCALVFVVSALTGLFVQLDLPPVRRTVQHLINQALSSVGPDSCRIDHLTHAGTDGFDVGRLECSFTGVGHLRLDGVKVRMPVLLDLIRLWAKPARTTLVRSIHVDRAEGWQLEGKRPQAESPTRFHSRFQPAAIDVERIRVEHALLHTTSVFSPDPTGAKTGALELAVRGASARLQVSLSTPTIQWSNGEVDAEARGLLPVPIAMRARSSGRWFLSEGTGTPSTHTTANLEAGDVAVEVDARTDGPELRVHALMPRVRAEAVRYLLQQSYVPAPDVSGLIAVRASARGRLPDLDAQVKIEALSGELEAGGRVHAQEPFSVDIKMAGRRLDLGRVRGQGLPRTRLGFHGRMAASLRPAMPQGESVLTRLSGEASLHLHPGLVGGVSVPPSDVVVRAAAGRLDASAQVAGPDAPMSLHASRAANGDVEFRADATLRSATALGRIARVRGRFLPVSGHAALHAVGTLRRGQLRLGIQLQGQDLRGWPNAAHAAGATAAHAAGSTDGATAALDRIGVSATIEGPIETWSALASGRSSLARGSRASTLSLDAVCTGLRFGGQSLAEATLQARGTPSDLGVRFRADLGGGRGALDAAGTVAWLGARTDVTGVSARVTRHGRTLWGSVQRVSLTPQQFDLAGLLVRGLGAPIEADARVRRSSEWQLRFQAPRIQLRDLVAFIQAPPTPPSPPPTQAPLTQAPPTHPSPPPTQAPLTQAPLTQAPAGQATRNLSPHGGAGGGPVSRLGGGLPRTGVVAGTAAIDLTIEPGSDTGPAHAHASVRVDGARFGTSPEMDGRLDATIEGATARVSGVVESAEIGRLHLEANPELGGSVTDPATWVQLAGRGAISLEAVRPGAMCSWVPCPAMLAQVVRTTQAELRARVELHRAPDRTASGAPSSPLAIEITGDVRDPKGVWVTGHARTELDVSASMSMRAVPPGTRFDVQVLVPRRALADLPAAVRPVDLAGAFDADLTGSGTLDEPKLQAQVHGYDLVRTATRSAPPALGFAVRSTYDGARLRADGSVRTASAEVFRFRAAVEAPAADWIGPHATKSRWSAGVVGAAQALPLGSIPLFANRGVGGELTGYLAVLGLHAHPLAVTELDLANVTVDSTPLQHAHLSARADSSACMARASLGRPGADLAAELNLGCRWEAGLLPTMAEDESLEATIRAHEFPLSALRPWFGQSAGRLAGTLDGALSVLGHPTPEQNDLVARGALQIRDGRFLVLPLGREVRRLQLRLVADGHGGLRIENLRGALGGGHFSGEAEAKLRGLVVQQVQARLHVPSGEEIPVTVEGVSYGTAWGDVTVDAHLENRELVADVRVPTLRLQMPSRSMARLESLEDNPDIELMQPLGPEPERTATKGAFGPGFWPIDRLVASIHLGSNVGLQREQMRLDVTTPPSPQNPTLAVEWGTTAGPSGPSLDGTVRLLGGTVPVAGRTFRIDRGLVRFGGTVINNPSLDIDAQTDAPDGTHVLVHVGGTLSSMDLTLTSQPPKSQSELLALLAFGQGAPASYAQGRSVGGGPGVVGGAVSGTGTGAAWGGAAGGGATGSSTTGVPGTGGAGAATPSTGPGSAAALGAAAGLGAGYLSAGINELLARSILPIPTTVSAVGATSAAASFQLNDRMRLEYVHQFGAAQYGQWRSDVNILSLDWRFRPTWLLRTLIGDRGSTSLELEWQHWY